MQNKIKLKIVDYNEIRENEFNIIIEILKGEGLINSALQNLEYGEGIEKVFRERDLRIDNSGYLIEFFDAKDNFTGDQEVLKELLEDVVGDSEAELNQLFI